MIDELRFATRSLRRSRGFTATLVVMLAVGVAINLTVMAVVETMLFRPAPGVAARDAVAILATSSAGRPDVASYRDFVDFREQNRTFARMAAYKVVLAAVTVGGEAFAARAALASSGYFEALGVKPAQGRFFTPDEDRVPNERAVAVLSYAMWQHRFGGADVLGQDVVLNNRAFRVIGIAPEGFRGTTITQPADLFVPMMMQPHLMPDSGLLLDNRGWSGVSMVGALRDGVTMREAQANIATIAAGLAAAYRDTNEGREAVVEPLAHASMPPSMRAGVRRTSAILGVMSLAMLVLVCASAANVLLARSVARIRETAVRLALGAGRLQVVQQFVAESFLVAMLASAAGLALTVAMLRILRAAVPAMPAVGIGPLTMLGAAALTIVSAMFCAAIASLAGARLRADMLRDAAGSTLPFAHRITGAIVVVQVALSILLLATTGLFLRSLVNLRNVTIGYEAEGLLAAELRVPPDERAGYFARILERVRSLPHVESAALGSDLPLSGDRDQTRARRDGAPKTEARTVGVQLVGAGYFQTLGMPLLRGRAFAAEDMDSTRTAVVNETLAKQFFAAGDAVGQRIRLGSGDVLEVIGVVADSRFGTLRDESSPGIFLPASETTPQPDLLSSMTLFVRTRGDVAPVARDVRVALRALDSDLLLLELESVQTLRDRSLAPERTLSAIVGTTSVLALLLAALGIYGVLSLSVALRTREVGVRIALGATPANVIRATMTRGLVYAALGVAGGAAAVAALQSVLRPLLFQTALGDPAVWAIVAFALAAAVAMASLAPALRASRVDPLVVLKEQ